MQQDAYHVYQAVSLGTRTAQASPVQLVLILMDGLLDELTRARAHIEAKRYEAKARSLDRCVSILHGLSSALDMEAGGDVVARLDELYRYCAHRLFVAGVELKVEMVDEVVTLLTTLRGGWQALAERSDG